MAVFITRDSKRFVDVSLAFEANPVTGDLPVLNNERAINNSLKNLMMIAVTEVPFDADIGSGVASYLFENVDEATADILEQEIKRVIQYSEHRVELVSAMGADMAGSDFNYKGRRLPPVSGFEDKLSAVRVEARPDQNSFMVSITYKIVGYEQIITFSQLLEPTR